MMIYIYKITYIIYISVSEHMISIPIYGFRAISYNYFHIF